MEIEDLERQVREFLDRCAETREKLEGKKDNT